MFASITTIQQQVYAGKEDKDYDGHYITQEQYENRLAECQKLQFKERIDSNIDCSTWVLTEEGYNKKYIEIN